jgi:hypothetical protein
MAPSRPTTADLLAALERYRDDLHAIPHVVGTGVGLRNDDPVLQVYVDLPIERSGGVANAADNALEGTLDRHLVQIIEQRSLPRADGV